MSTLEYLDPDGTVNFSFVSWVTLNDWLSKLNGNTHVNHKLPNGVNRGKVIEELERRGTSSGNILDKFQQARGFGKDWREHENEQGYTHLEELLIYQPAEWRKQAREYVYRFDWDLDRTSTNTKRQIIQKIDAGDGKHVSAAITLSSPVLVTLLHPEMTRTSRYEPLNFLLAYDVKDPLDDLKGTFEKMKLEGAAWQSFLDALSPLDYFFEFQRHVQLYDADKLRSIGKQAKFPRLCLMNELDFSNIIGQRMAKQMIREEVVRYLWNRGTKNDICRLEQPLSMIFAGPSGIGKTELAVWLSNLLNKPGQDAYLKVDCGKLSHANEVFGMSGAYQGAYEGSALNNFIVRMAEDPETIGIVLLDEIEKARKEVIHGLYQVLDKGEWTNKKLSNGVESQTETVSCQNVIFIMTTNAADDLICKAAAKSDAYYTEIFTDASSIHSNLESRVRKKLPTTNPFTNAFMGRVGRVIPFLPMSHGDLKDNHLLMGELMTVTKLLIEREQDKLTSNGEANVTQIITTKTKHNMANIIVQETIVEAGIRAIQKLVEKKMGNQLLHSLLLKKGGIKKGSQVEFSADKGNHKIDFRLTKFGQRGVEDDGKDWTKEEDLFG